ncbi:heat shock protein HslJ [Mariniflexile fucanivorans]|uniref:Heat shock protein HslJ n=1 Tax=Mariniflexile fucanivorans TaxID=264023 RepID=A0A4R1RDF6_9FLAO|nr:META domain-containing protein [Mariniflexile fucanivorans]TCL63829.1 heat shock protein HslJ [Mariniflexile fucanivorans]
MKSLKTIAALSLLVVLITSCASKKTGNTQNIKMELHDIWAVTHINEEAIIPSENVPNLEINITEMKVFGSDGCNNYTGEIKNITSENITFGALASTRKMCFDMAIPDKYNNALNNTVTYKRDKLNLYFYDDNGNKILSFKKVD